MVDNDDDDVDDDEDDDDDEDEDDVFLIEPTRDNTVLLSSDEERSPKAARLTRHRDSVLLARQKGLFRSHHQLGSSTVHEDEQQEQMEKIKESVVLCGDGVADVSDLAISTPGTSKSDDYETCASTIEERLNISVQLPKSTTKRIMEGEWVEYSGALCSRELEKGT